MFSQLLGIFRSDKPLRAMGENFGQMLKHTYDLTVRAGDIYFGKQVAPEERTRIYEQDIKVNQLERAIRKQVIAHLAIQGNRASAPYSLLLRSLVKDVERTGDYAKNLSEIVDFCPSPLPDDEIVAELREIRSGVESVFAATSDVFSSSDDERALELIHQGRDIAHRCDALVVRIARSDYDASTTTATVLGARHYKRISAHIVNVLSSVVMPLHKVDYYDEAEISA